MIDRNKYIVFKRKEFNSILLEPSTEPDLIIALSHAQLEDAVVFRTQDRFAAPILDVAAGILALVYETTAEAGDENPHLVELGDYYSDMAEESRKRDTKLPD